MFVLNLQEFAVNNGREQYRQILKQKCGYEKTLENLYDIFKDKTDVAIQRAKRQYESYKNETPSKRCPATRVYELVEELMKYL